MLLREKHLLFEFASRRAKLRDVGFIEVILDQVVFVLCLALGEASLQTDIVGITM